MTQSKERLFVCQETTMEDVVRRLNLIPGLHIKLAGKMLVLNDDGSATPASGEVTEFVDIDKELALQKGLPQRYRRFPKDKKLKPYVNKKPCKRKQKKK